ncbi:MAG: MFS transporter [Pseudomonadales bacterium]|nr:MFS transporter [Pseudomonadales bacterium]NIX07408.1 MFS transporter [Pseudomonadales bacterium]
MIDGRSHWSVGGRNYVLVLLTATAAFNFVDRQILGVLLEPIGQEFDLPDSLLGLLSGIAFAVFYAVLGIPIAALADRRNRRNIIVVCVALFSTMTALCGAVVSFWQLFLARIGVGVGEAGTMPASQSMLSDLFPVQERPWAMGLLATGGNIGLMLGLLIGGWVNEWFGWRAAFVTAAVPGALIAAAIYFTVPEPIRKHPATQRSSWLREALSGIRLVGSIRSVRRFAMGGTLYGLAAYGIHTWMPVYYIRYHGLSTGEAGTVISIIVGVLGGVGAFAGGVFCARLSRRDLRWNGWLPALAIFTSVPLLIAMLVTDNTWLAVGLFVVPGILSSVYAGPTWSIIQELVPAQRRAMAASVYMLFFNLIGLGLGPLTVGVLSDLYIPAIGDASLRWAMVSVLLVSLGGITAYLMAARSLIGDLDVLRSRPGGAQS